MDSIMWEERDGDVTFGKTTDRLKNPFKLPRHQPDSAHFARTKLLSPSSSTSTSSASRSTHRKARRLANLLLLLLLNLIGSGRRSNRLDLGRMRELGHLVWLRVHW
jgi:hypothetical protein